MIIFVYFPQVESSKKLSEIKSLHEKIRVSTDEAKKKEDAYKQLVSKILITFLLGLTNLKTLKIILICNVEWLIYL